jgi:hypothetical protein
MNGMISVWCHYILLYGAKAVGPVILGEQSLLVWLNRKMVHPDTMEANRTRLSTLIFLLIKTYVVNLWN